MRKIPLHVTLILLLAGHSHAFQQPAEPAQHTLSRDMKWRNIGPFRGGRSVAVTGVRTDFLTYYFGAVGGGVWKTGDAGETWENVSDGSFQTSSVGAIAVAPSDPNVIYVGMGEHAVRGVATSHGDGVYKSVDAGRTWKHLGLDQTRVISRIRVHPSNPEIVFVAAQGTPFGSTPERGIYRSLDGGENWEKVLFVNETSGASDLAVDPANPRILYAAFWDHQRSPWQVRSGGSGSGIHKSSDGGTTWRPVNQGLPELIGKIGIDVSADSERVYAIIEADPAGGLYRSDNAGTSWTLINSEWKIRTRSWYYMEVYADPRNPDVVYVLNAAMSKSVDGGKTFETIPVPHSDNHDLWINPNHPQTMINANDGGANISFNGGKSWSTQENQPTGQFYRVNTDNRFPYFVYGGQQDNTTIAIASRSFSGGIDEKNWYPVGGCESGYVAFDPDDPRLIYAGCYMGLITEFNVRTRSERNVMAYPVLPAAVPAREMKYRFNWNAPILVSQHNPSVLFHAANVLLKSQDRGLSWSEISPDLTRNEREKQGPGGGPITNEGAGGEIYNTIFYVAESPHDPGVLWTGSDDGLVHITRDGGQNWKDVTPDGLPESQINAIEVSLHDPATAYLAVTRYKFNALTPYVFKTTNFGESWESIVEGLAEDSWVRVVREDPLRRDLLYAGTETGVRISFNGGRSWKSLQRNLPVTPVTDLKVRDNDLVAATQGRAFWILDDLSPLRQGGSEVLESDFHLFEPSAAYRTPGSAGSAQANPRAGGNPPRGAVIDFYLREPAAGTAVKIEILDESGNPIRTFAGKTEKTGSGSPDEHSAGRIEPKKGMNRITWDLRHEPVTRVPGLYVFGSLRGRLVRPGWYGVRLSWNGQSQTKPLEVKQDPRIPASSEELERQEQLLAGIETELDQIHRGVIRLNAVREQLNDFLRRLKDETGNTGHEETLQEGQKLIADLDGLESRLIQKKTVDGQTVINFPMRLNQHYIFLLNAVGGVDPLTTRGQEERFADLSAQWQKHREELNHLLGPRLEAFNRRVWDSKIPAVRVPRNGPG